MKYTGLIYVLGIVLLAALPAKAIMFTFDDLSPLAGPDAISQYMTDLYGSDVSVRGAMAGPLCGSDRYLFSTVQAGGPTLFPFSIDIGFDNSIVDVQFSGAIFGSNPGHDFRLWAYTSGGTELLEVRTWDIPSAGQQTYWFESGLLTFNTPVDRLVFSNNFIYDVGIDNLSITAWGQGSGAVVPLPASTLLGCLGLVIVGISAFLKGRKALAHNIPTA